ncbi:uncharacterized protein [Triticum aestivum]|uniref:uncharacterized protein isoform X2 n=1 Tax=Triticum aestivum TaxID=4565 RepID=UPI001D0271E5|nr:uncharacterized protein LOC123131397 isoform X2 [Triticum aestivum]
MAAGVWNVLDWFPGGEAILRAESAFLSASTAAGGEDRISALHDHLLRDIVSRLPARDAARTAALAYRWRHLRELTLLGVHMPDCDNLDHLLPRSPVLDTLVVVLSRIFHHIHLCSQSLKSALLWSYYAQEIAVMDCPLLESLILCDVSFGEGDSVAVKIAAAPKLRVLGYLEPRVHQLKIGNNLIKPSPSTVVPSVKILALKVNFGVLKEVKMLASFLRCFPDIEMLHIESLPADERTRKHNAKFWRELCPIECLKSHVTEMIVHEFRGDRSEMEFLKFVDRSADEMLYLLVRTTAEIFASADEMDELMTKMEDFTHRGWVCDHSIVVHWWWGSLWRRTSGVSAKRRISLLTTLSSVGPSVLRGIQFSTRQPKGRHNKLAKLICMHLCQLNHLIPHRRETPKAIFRPQSQRKPYITI